ncbi:uncharacterized protein LOC122520881 [Polistes fuscatus]|uniref:uncharacterized protein LOC122520881 n=1 Tax=Polistes fuscatus TaxID=30207 RepID=UPI001CA84971|nr:uncharacterized protein LOC122520881 [Polistes fuscatus]
MSRISLKSRESSIRSLARRKKQKIEEIKSMKPIDFCCSVEDIDPLMRYDQRKPPYTSSLTAIGSLQESPAIKLRTQYINHLDIKKLITKGKDTQYIGINSEDFPISSINGAIQWYIEDEFELAKDILWEDRLRKNEEETRKNVRIGKANVEAKLKQMKGNVGPRWYQDFSIDQMRNLMSLEDVMTADYKQMETGRTLKILMAMGIVSTFFKIDPKTIRRMQRSCDFKAIDFLRETYRLLTGNYFEQEGYKKNYDCNERIILSAIAFLTLPETIIELDKRLPAIIMPKFPPKPQPMMILPRKKASSPYKEELFTRPDWVNYMTRLQRWRNYRKSLPIPKVILPDENCPIFTYKENLRNFHINNVIVKNDLSMAFKDSKVDLKKEKSSSKRDERLTKANENLTFQESNKKQLNSDITKLPDDNQIFDFTLSGLSENQTGPVKYKICGTLNPPRDNKKSWLGEKDAHFVISGVSDDPPTCPVSYEMTGVANVTPINSDERFYTVLKLGDGPNKIYPSGRKNLSKNWQEWLQNADEEFIQVEREANKILKSVEATMRLVFPGPTCDSCCSCRQTRKTSIMQKETKAPFMVIDALTEDERKQKYIVGSMALHSPPPTPHQSTVNLIEIIASEDKITTNVIINGVTTDKGEKKYYITGMKDETIHIPSRRVEPPPPLPLKNIPPCSCAIQQMFNQGVTPRLSTDNIPWTKDEGLCFGKKYRPDITAAYSCKANPGDKSCRLNPFLKEIVRLEMKKKGEKSIEEDYYTKEKKKKRMYSIADFQPCGDEQGMSVCGGPWGTRNILSPKELEELERQRKEILMGPPCGIRPGRAVCEGPFGERIPQPKKIRSAEEEDEEDEEEEEEEVIQQQPVPMKKEKILKRDKLCHASPESMATEKKIVKEKVTKFIPDPDYHGYDDPWNVFRTAPSVKETITEYEQSLKLSTPKPRSDPSQPILEVLKKRRKRKSSSNKESEIFKSLSTLSKEISSKIIDDEQQIAVTKVPSDKIKKEKKRSYPNDSTTKSKTSLKNNSINRSHDEKPKKGKNEQGENNLNVSTVKQIRKNISPLNLEKKSTKMNSSKLRKASKIGEVKKYHKKKSIKDDKVIFKPEDIKQEMKRLKTMMMSPDTYPHNIEPVVLPSEPPSLCKHEYRDSLEKESKDPASEEIVSEVKISKKGPCGWRTKSEQELPVKKTLAYLVDPDPPIEMIPVRKNGKACICRENRNKKKILMYQIGGSIGKKKIESTKLDKIGTKKKENKEERDDIRVIDGVIYYTPPPSRRRSDEYVPEYDLYESPYEKCVDLRKDSFINFLERYTTPRDVMSKIRDNVKPCDCSGYLDSYGIIGDHAEIEESKRLLKERERLMESKSPRERWALALKDKGLIDYYAGCKHKVPCWTTCAKFNKYTCPLKPQRLSVKKPVCECKYERKIIERKEERIKRKEREKKLKSFKKKVYTNVQNISRPMKADTKLIISDVKRIPRDDEYIDDVQYCISGVAENYTMGPTTTVVEGLNMGTPLHTPEPSKEIIPCVCLHSHWSPTNIPPGPLPRKEHALIEERKRRKEYLEKAARMIYGPQDEVNNSEEWYHSCKVKCEPVKMHIGKRKTNTKEIEEKSEHNQLINSVKRDTQKSLDAQKASSYDKKVVKKVEEGTNNNANLNQDITMMTEKKIHEETKKDNKVVVSIKKNSIEHEDRQDKDVNIANVSLENLIKKELKKMATEGFLFAKLPKCHRMQQIQNWIMYRKGFVCNDEETNKLLKFSFIFWGMADTIPPPKIVIPSLDMSKKEIHELTFDRAKEMKNKIAMKNAIFYSQLRKMRVLYSRYMWSTMEFRRYPCLSYKKAFFTYMPTKEADGHVFKPWLINDVREKD